MLTRRLEKKIVSSPKDGCWASVAAILIVLLVAIMSVLWMWRDKAPAHQAAGDKDQRISASITSTGSSTAVKNSAQELTQQLEDTIYQVTSAYGGSAGIAIAVPRRGASISQAGTLVSDVAWSTSKVPIAMAVVHHYGAVDNNIISAITMSDNTAAEAMWAALGEPMSAAQAVNSILRIGGDSETVINTAVTRPGYTVFGQTQWSLSNQAVFGAGMLCAPGGPEIAELMGSISEDQAYGLGRIPGAAFKGGWGPDIQDNYLVRQFGLIPSGDAGQYVGVAIAAKAGDGTYASGQAMLNDVADSLSQLALPAGQCG